MNGEPNQQEKRTNRYLEYLDKEMSIMGILSTFCLAVPALVLERLASATGSELAKIWSLGEPFFWVGSLLLLFSAALFYKERSLLAFYYGRIALGKPPDGVREGESADWIYYADSRTTWIPYDIAYWLVRAAAIEYVFGFCSGKYQPIRQHVCWYVLIPVIATIVICPCFALIAKDRRIRFRDNAWLWRCFNS